MPPRNKDALNMALGEKPDHPGRVRGVGGINVGIRKVYGDSGPKARKTTTADRESIKKELREELREEFEGNLKENLSSILQGMGITLPNQSLGSNSVQPNNPIPSQLNPEKPIAPSQQNLNVPTPTSEPNDPTSEPVLEHMPTSDEPNELPPEFEVNHGTMLELLVLVSLMFYSFTNLLLVI